MAKKTLVISGNNTVPLLNDIRQLIEASRQELAVTVNSALTLLYWHIGQRIHNEVLQGERAGYGEQIIALLAKQLEADYGRGFSSKSLRHMLRFAEVYPDIQIVSAVRRQLPWTHNLIILSRSMVRPLRAHHERNPLFTLSLSNGIYEHNYSTKE